MKKLIFIIVLFPFFCLSQTLLDNVKTECYTQITNDLEQKDCNRLLEGTKIYLEKNYVVFDFSYKKEKYKVLEVYGSIGSMVYVISYNDKKHLLTEEKYSNGKKYMLLISLDKKEYMSYE